MSTFEIIYWLGIGVELIVRAPLNRKWKSARKTERRFMIRERIMLGLLWLAMFILPVVYSASDWLDFANYRLPDWLGWVGALILACALLVFILAHRDLKANWSPTLEIFDGHTLVTSGIYARIRHPIYASQWLWVIAQTLLLHNWIAGFSNLIIFVPFYFLRVRAEEQMMLDTFGEPYRAYLSTTGAVLPGLGRRDK
jgi:protein-S-isoprenylcysteine O-methyltransferase Ste14